MPVRLVGVPWDATTLGRKGARLAPEAIRRELAHLHPFDATTGRPVAWLAGKDLTLSEEHGDLLRSVARVADQEATRDPEAPLVLLGGDHAISFAGVSAVHRRYPELRVLSLDAHLDLRGVEGGPSNGNWALRCVQELSVPYAVAGVGRFSNDPELLERARALRVPWASARDLRGEGRERALAPLLSFAKGHDLYLTLDIDVVDQGQAPGVSAPAADGLSVELVGDLLARFSALARVRGFDVAEVNPTVDPAGITPRAAAYLLLGFLATTGT